MDKQQLFAAIAIIMVATSIASSSAVSARFSIGVKVGDWIEYRASTSGTPPLGHDAKWGRMEVKRVLGDSVNFNVTTQMADGSFLYENVTLNLRTGQLGDDFLIPASMSTNETIFDARSGNITVIGTQQRIYAGATRTVISGSTQNTNFSWDQQSGILVEAHSSYPSLNFTMDTITERTNIWEPQGSQNESIEFYSFAIVLLIIGILVFTIGLLLRGKRSAQQQVSI